MKKEIAWEKWRDPFGNDFEDEEWPGAHGCHKVDKIIQKATSHATPSGVFDVDISDEIEEEDFNRAIKEYQRQELLKNKRYTIMMTPMGVIPMTETSRAGKVFNFWIGHTNFRLTKNSIDTIDDVDGIESFDYFTPYRFRISIGKAFDTGKVKTAVVEALNSEETWLEEFKKLDKGSNYNDNEEGGNA